ncbi:hypothetical protein [Nocardia sp. NPDC004711]
MKTPIALALSSPPARTSAGRAVWPLPADGDGPAVHLVAEWAIRLPNGRWWRSDADRAVEPRGTEPTTFHTRAEAVAEIRAIRKTLSQVYGIAPATFRPLLSQRAVRATASGASLGALSTWRATPAKAAVAS